MGAVKAADMLTAVSTPGHSAHDSTAHQTHLLLALALCLLFALLRLNRVPRGLHRPDGRGEGAEGVVRLLLRRVGLGQPAHLPALGSHARQRDVRIVHT